MYYTCSRFFRALTCIIFLLNFGIIRRLELDSLSVYETNSVGVFDHVVARGASGAIHHNIHISCYYITVFSTVTIIILWKTKCDSPVLLLVEVKCRMMTLQSSPAAALGHPHDSQSM